jgi:hypothetical protein
MSFASLPNELIDPIFAAVQSQGPLHSLSLCCRRFSEVVKPHLYSRFNQKGIHNTPAFLRTLLEKAELRTFVRQVDLSSPEGELENGVQCFELPFLSDREGNWLEGYLPEFGSEEREVFRNSLFCQKNWDSVTTLILMLCSRNLENVRIYSGQSKVKLLRGLLDLAARSQRNPGTPCFSNLTQIHLQIGRHADFQWRFLLSCFTIKSVSTVSMNGFVDDRFSKFRFLALFPTNVDPDYFVTSKLSFLNSVLDPNLLRRFLPCFYFLKTFEFEEILDSDWDSGRRQLQVMTIKAGLAHSKHCLEELVLSGKRTQDELLRRRSGRGIDWIEPIGSLVEFEKLRLIDMDSEYLVGSETLEEGYWDDDEEYLCLEVREDRGTRFHYFPEERRSNFISCLPASIEHLIIRDCTDAIFDCVSDLLLDTKPPKLQTLKVRPRQSVCWTQS